MAISSIFFTVILYGTALSQQSTYYPRALNPNNPRALNPNNPRALNPNNPRALNTNNPGALNPNNRRTLHPNTPRADTLNKLQQWNVDPNRITVSGFSSGGTFAQQLLVSYSSKFLGTAVFSHTYYRCGNGNGNADEFDRVCTRIGNSPPQDYYDPNLALRDIQNYAEKRLIEDPNNLRNKKLYVYAGTHNALFTSDQSLRIVNVLGTYIPPLSIQTRVQAANLTLPSDTFGGPCSADARRNFYISNCGLSGPFEALTFLLQPQRITKGQTKRNSQLEPLYRFDQKEFFPPGNIFHSMDSEGFFYIPSTCRNNYVKCLLHFYFHGCLTGSEFVGNNHILNSGYLELAEANGIIVVFPQVQSSNFSRIGCWDTFGATGPLYATQQGVQVNIVYRMIQRILGQNFF